MNFEPQKFFIGLVEFFSVILPGALLTYLLKNDVGPRLLGSGYAGDSPTEAGLIFLFSSYLLGHFVFLVGSWLLDDFAYDKLRAATSTKQIKRLAKGENLSFLLSRRLAAFFFKPDVDKAVDQAVLIKEHYLKPLNAVSAVNAFQWAKARLTTESSEALATVQRFEADSKFFRSLVVVLVILIPWALLTGRWVITVVCVPFLILAFWRYIDQRSKSTNQAYWYIITREAASPKGYRATGPRPEGDLTHAGGVVFRTPGRGGTGPVEYLLVSATKRPDEWVLPKGHIEPLEPVGEAAVREVREETGVWAAIRAPLKTVTFPANDEIVRAQFFLMEFLEESRSAERRGHAWKTLQAALEQTRHPETHGLLKLADQVRASRAFRPARPEVA